MALIAELEAVVLHAAVSALPAPTNYTAGNALTTLTTGVHEPGANSDAVRAVPESAMLYIRGDAGATVTIPGPVEVRAGRGSAWYRVGQLDGGATSIEVSQFQGYAERIYLGGSWERLALVAADVLTGGTVTVELAAERVW